MDRRTEEAVAVAAALLVLFSAMWNPITSAGVVGISLLALGAHRLWQFRSRRR